MSDTPIVKIAGVVGGMSVAIVAIICIFAPRNLWVAPPIVGALAAMGVVLGFFAREKSSN